MSEKGKDDKPAFVLKAFVFCVPAATAAQFSKSDVILGLSLIVGSLLQSIIPPRKKGLLPMLAISITYTLASFFWDLPGKVLRFR